ncbi:MAG TPA: hypothetical protein VH280_14535 [Verrucomicrobiae bacterium]|jgi:hypothetical protein|nr:hypothetical protein [Verrucomicrobiae bacterium]
MMAKILKLVAAAAALSLLAGCVVFSVYPFYMPKDLVFDSSVTGHWMESKSPNVSWQFDDVGGKYYLLTVMDTERTNGFEAKLFQLKNYRFLDLLTTNRDPFRSYEMPVHLICKVAHNGETNLSLHFLDYGWLSDLLSTNPSALRHVIVPDEAGDTTNHMVYLTAETKELQKFLLKHVDDTNAFSSDSAVELNLASH